MLFTKKIEINNIFDFKFVSKPGFSPNGEYAAFIVQTASEKENKYLGNIWILDVNSKTIRQLTTEGDVKNYVWTKRNTLLFSAVRDNDLKDKIKAGEEITCWYEQSPKDRDAKLAFALPLFAKSLLPVDENRYVVCAAFDNNRPDLDSMNEEQKQKALKELKDPSCIVLEEAPFWSNGGTFTSGKRQRLYIYDHSAKELTAITDPWFNTEKYSVFGSKIIYKGILWREVQKLAGYAGLWVYDVETKSQKCVLAQGTIRNGSFTLRKDGLILIDATDEKQYGVYQYRDFYTIDINSNEMKKIADYDNPISRDALNSDARLGGGRLAKTVDDKYYFITTVDGGSYLRYIDDKGNISELLTPYGDCNSFDIYGNHILTCGMYENKMNELYLDGKQITFFNDEWTKEHSVITPEYHAFKDPDGYEVHGWAIKPLNYKKGEKYPAILHIHGGPRTAFGPIYHHEMQMWANAGYFVLYCNPRGGDGQGSDFGNIRGKFGTVDYQNIMSFTDEMLEKYPEIDEKRLGVAGGSYGGFMTNWIIGHTDRFKAAVSQRSISSWITMEHVSDIGMWYVPDNQSVATHEDIEKIWWHSPLKYADRCKTPTLFIHSDEDYRCLLVEGLSMYTALKNHGCEARMCVFKGENHELSRSGKPLNRIRRMTEILNWFNSHLSR